MSEKFMGQWTEEKAWAWHNARPWRRGMNYLPSNCTTMVEMWQEYEFEQKFAVMENEIKLARDTGFNTVRMAMSFPAWADDPKGVHKRLDKVLDLLDKNGFTMMARFGNDCTVPKDEYMPVMVGKQPPVAWGHHGGVAASPHRSGMNTGWLPIDDPELEPRFYAWVKDIISAHRDDPRVEIWNLWNEAGNTKRFNLSEKYLRHYFEIAREIGTIQPLTADSWLMTFNKDLQDPLGTLREIEVLAMNMSDIVSFHHYGAYENVVAAIMDLKKRYNRPLYNTEWLHRIFDNNIEQIFPLFYLEGIGSYHYGLVEGQAQYYEPWDNLRDSNLPIDRWQHDIYRANHRPYSHKEIALIKAFSARADKDFAAKKRGKEVEIV